MLEAIENAGVTGVEIVMETGAAVAQYADDGVKVYVPEVVLLTVAGDQVPTIELFEVVGSTGAVDPEQTFVENEKVGVCAVLTTV